MRCSTSVTKKIQEATGGMCWAFANMGGAAKVFFKATPSVKPNIVDLRFEVVSLSSGIVV